MQTLIADATHQLRTPISALRSQAELAVDEPDPERLRLLARGVQNRAVGLSRLADQLLNQALVIHRAETAPLTRIDIRAVAARAAAESDRDNPDLGPALKLHLPEEPAETMGDLFSLAEATKNLINNASRDGKPPILLSVEPEVLDDGRDAWALCVSDYGAGVPDALLAGNVQRFARSDPEAEGEASHKDANGGGLGLAIVREVIGFHDGALRFERSPDGRFRAILAVPAAGEETP